jgi:hypothetical protein
MPKKDDVSKTRKILQQLQKIPANKKCAECNSKQPTWASTNLGVFVCIRCSSVHRSMGTHISKVKSATLDIWKMDTVENFKLKGGNQKVNMVYEAKLPNGQKPTAGSDMYLVERFIRDKYERKMWFSEKKNKKKKRKDSSSDSDEKNLEDDSDSSETSSKSPSGKKKKNSKKKTGRRREKFKVKDKKHTEKKTAEIVSKEKKKRKKATPKPSPQPPPEPVIDILDVSVLSFGDEPESEKNTVFDSNSFVNDLLSSEKDAFANTKKSSAADLDFGDFFGGPSTSQTNPKAAVSDPSIKPSTNDIMGMFKNKAPTVNVRRQSQDIFGVAGPRAQPMPPIGLDRQMPKMMMRQPPMHNAQYGFPPVMNQNVINYPRQPMNNVQVFNKVPNAQGNQSNLSSNMFQNRSHPPTGFSNPKPQSSAFDALMSGNVPIKSQPPSTKAPSSRYVPSKPSGHSLNIDLNGWMS